jgi:hypothetical protein
MPVSGSVLSLKYLFPEKMFIEYSFDSGYSLVVLGERGRGAAV